MNKQIRKNAKNNFKIDLFKVMNNVVFEKNFRKFEKT